jgi:hypothetical protein
MINHLQCLPRIIILVATIVDFVIDVNFVKIHTVSIYIVRGPIPWVDIKLF